MKGNTLQLRYCHKQPKHTRNNSPLHTGQKERGLTHFLCTWLYTDHVRKIAVNGSSKFKPEVTWPKFLRLTVMKGLAGFINSLQVYSFHVKASQVTLLWLSHLHLINQKYMYFRPMASVGTHVHTVYISTSDSKHTNSEVKRECRRLHHSADTCTNSYWHQTV